MQISHIWTHVTQNLQPLGDIPSFEPFIQPQPHLKWTFLFDLSSITGGAVLSCFFLKFQSHDIIVVGFLSSKDDTDAFG